MKVFVLDNSLRESTVGQVMGHTLKDKFEILEATGKCGFHHQILGAFGSGRRVDDDFSLKMKKLAEDLPNRAFYAFSEAYLSVDENGCMQTGEDFIPVGLQKMKLYGIPNVIIEIDIGDSSFDWDRNFTVEKCVEHITFLLKWAHQNLAPPSVNHQEKKYNFINLRDFPFAMVKNYERVLEFVKLVAQIPAPYRPVGLLHEEPVGEYFPEEIAGMNQMIRDVMDENGWPSLFQQDGETLDGLILAHVHKQWGLADAVALDVLSNGADGVWASICEEGAAMGHASSCVTLANLGRLGNKDVLTRYNTKFLAKAARITTEKTINQPVPARQIVYGPRAVEAVFGFSGIAGGKLEDGADVFDKDGDGKITDVDHFSLASFLGVDDPPIRISTLASAALVAGRLKQCFGEDDSFNEEVGASMLQKMKEELIENESQEHTSPTGIALLYYSTTDSMTERMKEVVSKIAGKEERHKAQLKEAKECFLDYAGEGEESMSYQSFYEAYLQPFFGCFTCPRTRFVLDAINLNDDQRLDWKEWNFWCTLALQHHAEEIFNLDDLHNFVLRNAILAQSLQSKNNTENKITEEKSLQAKNNTKIKKTFVVENF